MLQFQVPTTNNISAMDIIQQRVRKKWPEVVQQHNISNNGLREPELTMDEFKKWFLEAFEGESQQQLAAQVVDEMDDDYDSEEERGEETSTWPGKSFARAVCVYAVMPMSFNHLFCRCAKTRCSSLF